MSLSKFYLGRKKLKARCPFCGGQVTGGYGPTGIYMIICENRSCGADMAFFGAETEEESVKHFERRCN